MKNSSDSIGNRTRSAVPQPAPPPCTLSSSLVVEKFPLVNGALTFVAAFAKARHLSVLSHVNSVHALPSSFTSSVILPPNVRAGSKSPAKVCVCIVFSIRATCPAHILLTFCLTIIIIEQHVMTFHILQCSSSSSYFLLRTPTSQKNGQHRNT